MERNPVSEASVYLELCITAEKPGFCDNFCIIAEIVERNPVSEASVYLELCITAEKPGFCDNFCIITEIVERNPVSEPPRLVQETGFLR
ncbi:MULTISPECIES: hypothetical protein [unclassified Microcoleus]|uniref:hypothetical protein n=1 Tax=unclassified Microcoleus TaxID=2642155 RepID=UPI00260142A0|nr:MULTISPECIES: hypothetical protein [unclassified Microcoleus]